MRTMLLSVGLIAFASLTTRAAVAAEPFVITVPGQGWTVTFESPPLLNCEGRSEGRNFQFRAAGEGGFNLSLFVEEPQAKRGGNEASFDYYWPLAKRNPLIDQESVKVTKTEKYVKVSYFVKADGDGASPNVNYYFVYHGNWIDLHISRFPSGKDDQEVLALFEKSLKYQESKAAK